MEEDKYGLGDAALNLDLTKPMRSMIADALVPPPAHESKGKTSLAPSSPEYDPMVISEKIWTTLMAIGDGSEFDVKFYLKSGKGFTLIGDRERFGMIQPTEPFMEVHERLIEVYHNDMIKIDLFTDERAMTFSSYGDFLEWLEL